MPPDNLPIRVYTVHMTNMHLSNGDIIKKNNLGCMVEMKVLSWCDTQGMITQWIFDLLWWKGLGCGLHCGCTWEVCLEGEIIATMETTKKNYQSSLSHNVIATDVEREMCRGFMLLDIQNLKSPMIRRVVLLTIICLN